MTGDPRNDNATGQGGEGRKADTTSPKHSGNSAEDQRARLLAWFKDHHRITTIEARRDLDIMMPAARVFELRNMGHNIALVWIHQHTDAGKLHRVGLYTYAGEAI